jgi:hypothetical protein
LAALFVGYILLEVLGPQPTNWVPNYAHNRYSPFGSELVYLSLEDIFPGQEVKIIEESPAKALKEFEDSPKNYIIIQDEFKTNQFEAKALLDFVARGNHVFIAANQFKGSLADSLKIRELDSDFISRGELTGGLSKTTFTHFSESIDEEQKDYPILDGIQYSYFPGYTDGFSLGAYSDGHANFRAISHGEGQFLLHTMPLMFTNFYMVDTVNYAYISTAFSQMPVADVMWDNYFKPGKIHTESPVGYLLDNKSLKWAWFVTLGGLLMFMMFEAKRKQRIIPLIEPPANTTLEFTQTVGMLYYKHGDHKDIAEKKAKHLLEYIRNRWNLPTTEINEEFKQRLAGKSGYDRNKVDALFLKIQQMHKADEVEEEALLQFSGMVDHFYENTH